MPDRKTVMSWLEGLTQDDWQSFHSDSEVQQIAIAALALLKEQEAMKPISKSRHGANPQIQHFCRRCNAMLFRHKQKYCHVCGQVVTWNA